MVCVSVIVPLALSHRVPVAERARKETFLGDAEEATEKFGPLKVVLKAIPAFYADREVRQQHPAQNSPQTNTFSGIRRCRKHD